MAVIDPCLPPTTNTLDPLQRQRLLKSTQKVGALLGTTPRVLEQGMDITRSCSMRAERRRGKVFYKQAPSASSSKTSLSSDASGSDMWILSSEPALIDGHGHRKCSSSPITIQFPCKNSAVHPTVTKQKPCSSFITPQKPLSQPLLYRMRSKPIPIPPPIISPLTSPEIPSALMPTKSTTTCAGSARRRGGLTEGDRRKKMAKVVRTLGENIPPELVFGGSPSSTASQPPQRSSSLRKSSDTTSSQPLAGRNQQRPRSKSSEVSDVVVDSPVVFRITKTVEECTSPIPTSNSTSTLPPSTSNSASSSTSSVATITHSPSPRHRKHRPRSLTLSSIPVRGDKGNIVIEQGDDVSHTSRKGRSFDFPSSTSAYDSDNGSSTTIASIEMTGIEYGKRKEKEWSGEWNVRDMGQVAKALRGLRCR